MITIGHAFNFLKIIHSIESPNEALDKLNTKLDEQDVSKYLQNINCSYNQQPITWKFTCYLFYFVDQIIDNSVMDSLDLNQINLITEAIHKCESNSLEICVKKHKSRTTYDTTNLSDAEYIKLFSCLKMFNKFFSIKFIASNPLFQDAQIDYLVGVLSILSMKKNEKDFVEANQMLYKFEFHIGTEQFFQFIMMVRGFQGLSKNFQIQAQIRLLQLIRSKDGFYMLCKMILRKKSQEESQSWQKYSIIAGILEKAMKNKNFYQKIINEVFNTLRNCLKKNENEIIAACVFVIKELHSKKDVEVSSYLDRWILQPLIDLIHPQMLLCGSILMEYGEIKEYIEVLHVCFSSSTIVSLPSKILHDYINILFNLFSILPDLPERDKLVSVILFVLNNYDRKELEVAVRHLRLKDDPNVNKLHQRIVYKNNSLQIGEEKSFLLDDTEFFIMLLKNANNNLLVYEIFICLLQLLSSVQNADKSIITGYDLDEDELTDVLHRKFYKQLSIIEPLQEMIQWKSLNSQFNENPKEILDAVKDVLQKTDDDQIVMIFFSIYKEMLHKLTNEDDRIRMRSEILKLKAKFKKQQLQEQIDIIFSSDEDIPTGDQSEFSFSDAMKLLKSKEVYCKVYGCDTFVKLLKRRDKTVIANRHTVLAVALQNMKETESYAYLNIIKLLVALSYFFETEVMDALMAEYQNNELDIDERLKFGESIVKVTENLGELAMKFKQQLINCFLKGSRDSNNEFRASSLANLGTICRLLCYQVHSFFNEMLQQLEIIIKCDEYLPARRAAAMVLSQVLVGMQNLMDFQDFLLPIYRLLKDVLATENEDHQTKLHAQIGLEHLNEMTKDFLNPKLAAEKEIKISLGDDHPNKVNEIKYK